MNFKFYYLDQKQHIHISGGSRISQMEGRQPKRGDANLLFGIIFAENCLKIKTFGQKGGRLSRSLDPPMYTINSILRNKLRI